MDSTKTTVGIPRVRIRFEWLGGLQIMAMLCLFGVLLQCATVYRAGQTNDATAGATSVRTVIPSEIGLIFTSPNGFDWKDVGAYVGSPLSGYFAQMSRDAIKVPHGRFQFFAPADDTQFSLFPYSQMKTYDAQEVAAGRPSLFLTATYKGKRRPVYFSWSLGLQGNIAAGPSQDWMQAVDVASDRFIDFWINRYVKAVLWKNGSFSSPWVGIDDCAFRWHMYGVVDDDGRFVTGVPWDPPFPQNSDDYLVSIEQFFHKLARRAPEIKPMCNVGSLEDWSQFRSLYADVPGVMHEDIFSPDPREFSRFQHYQLFDAISWLGSQGRVAILRAIVEPDNTQDFRTAYMIYLLLKGTNFFFAPKFKDSTTAVPPVRYAAMRSDLGEPADAMRIESPATKMPYHLYSRTYERGIVYVNWTGRPQTVGLPADRAYFDSTGNRVTTITVDDLRGTYVTTAKIKKPEMIVHDVTLKPAQLCRPRRKSRCVSTTTARRTLRSFNPQSFREQI